MYQSLSESGLGFRQNRPHSRPQVLFLVLSGCGFEAGGLEAEPPRIVRLFFRILLCRESRGSLVAQSGVRPARYLATLVGAMPFAFAASKYCVVSSSTVI